MPELLHLPAVEIARRIRVGELRSVQAVSQHIEHARRVNPELNAIVQDRFDLAMQEAHAADKRVSDEPAESLPPLLGVPCTIKECFGVEGMPQTAGLPVRKGMIAATDATAVARLRAAGAIPLGVTNLSELCMWMESENQVYGRCNNPYDAGRIVGGSSGGEGSIVGSGASPFGLGADAGGSIRMPAFFNGVFGHKPSGGLVPGTGQWPIAHGKALRYLTSGPLARRAEDLMPLLRVLAGPDDQDSGCEAMDLHDPVTVDLSSLTVYDVPDNGRTRVSDDLRATQRRVADHLESLGARVIRGPIAGLERSYDIWGSMLHRAGGPSFSERLGGGSPVAALKELALWSVRRTDHTLPAILLAALESTADFPKGKAAKWEAAGLELEDRMHQLLGDDGVLLYPSYSRTAPRHYAPLLRPFDWVYTAILAVLQLAVTQVPLGLDPRGLPLGVQVGAGRGQDHLTIAVALELERAFGGWVPPPVPGLTRAPRGVGRGPSPA